MLVAQSRPTLCNPMDCSPPGSSVHGILQARILEWIAIPFSRGSSGPRDQILVSCIAGRFFTIWAIGKFQLVYQSFSRCLWSSYYVLRAAVRAGTTTENKASPVYAYREYTFQPRCLGAQRNSSWVTYSQRKWQVSWVLKHPQEFSWQNMEGWVWVWGWASHPESGNSKSKGLEMCSWNNKNSSLPPSLPLSWFPSFPPSFLPFDFWTCDTFT